MRTRGKGTFTASCVQRNGYVWLACSCGAQIVQWVCSS